MTEIILILVVALFAIGPDKLPSFARKLGEGLREFRKFSSEATKEIRESVIESVFGSSAFGAPAGSSVGVSPSAASPEVSAEASPASAGALSFSGSFFFVLAGLVRPRQERKEPAGRHGFCGGRGRD